MRLAAVGIVTVVVTLAAGLELGGNTLFPFLFGDDLIPSYMAGTFVRQGRAADLMDFSAAEAFQSELRRTEDLNQHGHTGHWLNPPFFSLPFAALSVLPYRSALWTWFGLNLGMLAGSIVLLYRMLPATGRRAGDGFAIAGLVVCSMPCLQAMACQQNTFLSLLILTTTVTLWRADRAAWAGAVAGLLAFKPQLALIVWAAMGVSLGWRAAAGAAMTVGTLGATTLVVLPGTLSDYLAKLPTSLPYLQLDRPYLWERQVTPTGFARLFFTGNVGGPPLPFISVLGWAGAAIAGVVLAAVLWRMFRGRRNVASLPNEAWSTGRDRGIVATVTAMPLIMPYYMDYDLLLLAVPAVLLAAERMTGGGQASTSDRWAIAAWSVLYLWVYVNAEFGDTTSVSLTVPLLALVAGISARRAIVSLGSATPLGGEAKVPKSHVDPQVGLLAAADTAGRSNSPGRAA